VEFLTLHGDVLTEIFITVHASGKSNANIDKFVSMDGEFAQLMS